MKRERLTEANPEWAGKMYWKYKATPKPQEIDNVYFRLKEYEDLEEQGLLVRLPCKVGKVVYRINKGKVAKFKVTAFKLDGVRLAMTLVDYERMWKYCDRSASTFGKTTFLTRQEAEKALEEI